MKLVIVGTVAFDAIETPVAKIDKVIGGSATYIGLSASHFINNINLVSVIGDDFPQETLKEFRDRGIDTQGLEVVEGGKSFFWSGKYHFNMNDRDTLVTDLNVLADFNPVLPDGYRDAEFLLLGNIEPGLQIQVMEQMNQRPHLIIMDTMNFWMDNSWDTLIKAVSMVDVLVINDEEARQLSKELSLKKAAIKILEMGPKYLIIKKGEHGALLFDRDYCFFAPALPLEEVFDPTGAGDTFAGGFIGYLMQSGNINFANMKNALVVASAMASFCVERFGPERLLEITQDDIQNRVQMFVDLCSFDMEL